MIFFNRVLDYSQTEIKKFSIPSLLTRTTNDITQVQMLITMGLQVVTRGPIMAIWAIGKILGHSEYWLWAVLVAVIVNVLSDDRFDDASLSKTVLDSKSD